MTETIEFYISIAEEDVYNLSVNEVAARLLDEFSENMVHILKDRKWNFDVHDYETRNYSTYLTGYLSTQVTAKEKTLLLLSITPTGGYVVN